MIGNVVLVGEERALDDKWGVCQPATHRRTQVKGDENMRAVISRIHTQHVTLMVIMINLAFSTLMAVIQMGELDLREWRRHSPASMTSTLLHAATEHACSTVMLTSLGGFAHQISHGAKTCMQVSSSDMPSPLSHVQMTSNPFCLPDPSSPNQHIKVIFVGHINKRRGLSAYNAVVYLSYSEAIIRGTNPIWGAIFQPLTASFSHFTKYDHWKYIIHHDSGCTM